MKHFYLTFLMACFMNADVFAQDSPAETKRFQGSVLATIGYDYDDRTEWSLPGIDYNLNYKINDDFGLQFRIGFNRWNDSDRFSLPSLIGVYYNALDLNSYNLQILASGGASLEVGNDYAGEFAAYAFGLQMMPKYRKRIIGSLSLVQHMAFHGHNDAPFLRARIGYVF